jgi:2-polyprenyl-3-methyl-5-hydroxy-6-metoxy-1,4-benzoquinol methylase
VEVQTHPSILNTLEALQLTSNETKEIYSNFTRDKELIVWRDRISHVIFIDGYYVGDEVYTSGGYHKDLLTCSLSKKSEQPSIDNERRFKQFLNMIKDSQVADFGCGDGKFLMKAKQVSQSVLGVELQTSHINHLRKADIPCHNSLDGIRDHSLDTCFMFHVFEHLPDPLQTLLDTRCRTKSDDKKVIEVTQAQNFHQRDLKTSPYGANILYCIQVCHFIADFTWLETSITV